MKKAFNWLTIATIIIFWPLSFYVANQNDWLNSLLATSVMVVGYLLYSYKCQFHQFIYLLLPIINPVFLPLPLILSLFFIKQTNLRSVAAFVILYLAISSFSVKPFFNHSIFTPDPLATDTLVKKISLIPDRFISRIYFNKTTIYQNKFIQNLMVMFDPNYYFFGLHPMEIGDRQNLLKYPTLATIPFLVGLYFFPSFSLNQLFLAYFTASFTTLGLINNPDRYDTIIYFPISLVIIFGINKLRSYPRFFSLFLPLFLLFSTYELARILIINLK